MNVCKHENMEIFVLQIKVHKLTQTEPKFAADRSGEIGFYLAKLIRYCTKELHKLKSEKVNTIGCKIKQ